MKELNEITVNGTNQDCIIEYFMAPEKDDKGKTIWAHPTDNIAKCRGRARCIFIYAKDMDDNSKARLFAIDPYSIKKLYSRILEIEKLTSEEFID